MGVSMREITCATYTCAWQEGAMTHAHAHVNVGVAVRDTCKLRLAWLECSYTHETLSGLGDFFFLFNVQGLTNAVSLLRLLMPWLVGEWLYLVLQDSVS